MTGIMPARTACSMTLDCALPSGWREAKTRRASTPQEPTSLIRWPHRSAGADMPTIFFEAVAVAVAVAGAWSAAGAGAAVADWVAVVLRMAVIVARPATMETQT